MLIADRLHVLAQRGHQPQNCGHLVKDRMEQSAMRWSRPGAQAVLDLRAVRINDDWDDYQRFRCAPYQRLTGRLSVFTMSTYCVDCSVGPNNGNRRSSLGDGRVTPFQDSTRGKGKKFSIQERPASSQTGGAFFTFSYLGEPGSEAPDLNYGTWTADWTSAQA
jgi:hypothetical protein